MSRIEELLRSMTWDEKLAQMQIVFRPDPAELERWVRAGVGAVFWPGSAWNSSVSGTPSRTRLGSWSSPVRSASTSAAACMPRTR